MCIPSHSLSLSLSHSLTLSLSLSLSHPAFNIIRTYVFLSVRFGVLGGRCEVFYIIYLYIYILYVYIIYIYIYILSVRFGDLGGRCEVFYIIFIYMYYIYIYIYYLNIYIFFQSVLESWEDVAKYFVSVHYGYIHTHLLTHSLAYIY